MLLLKLRFDDAVSVFDIESNRELGKIIRIKSKDFSPASVTIGFDFLPQIKIVRQRALEGRDSNETSNKDSE